MVGKTIICFLFVSIAKKTHEIRVFSLKYPLNTFHYDYVSNDVLC